MILPLMSRNIRRNQVPTWTWVSNPIAGRPFSVTIRSVNRAGANVDDEEVFRRLANNIRDFIRRSLRAWRPRRFNRTTSYSNIRGYLTATNIHGWSVSRYFESNLVAIQHITPMMCLEILNRIHQSGGDVSIYDVEWTFVFQQSTLNEGGNPRAKKPEFVCGTQFADTWKGYRDQFGDICCAAYALNRVGSGKNYRGSRKKFAQADARQLQAELNWGPTISIPMLQDYVDKYPTKRVVVLKPMQTKVPEHDIFTGDNFRMPEQVNNERTYENCLYLIYDPEQEHFGACLNPRTMMRHMKDHLKWCHWCCSAYSRKDRHECEGNYYRPSEKSLRQCPHCNLYGKHECTFRRCKSCTIAYKTDIPHRCLLMGKERDAKANKFVGMPGIEKNQGYSAVWVYDLECRMKAIQSIAQRIQGFEICDDGSIQSVHGFEIQEHVANLVWARNVYTGEEKHWFGDRCLDDFLDFILAYNKGDNICIAHNGSGYDTRLVFQKAKERTEYYTFHPIMRGTKFMSLKINKTCSFIDSMLHVKGKV